MLDKIRNYINENNMIKQDEKIVVGISGGADSVCLLVILCQLYGSDKIVGVHINHMLRGDDANQDEEYVVNLCSKLGIELVAFRQDILEMASSLGISTEEAGRKYRYECFNKVAKDKGCEKVAVAHHKNDLAETVLFNIIRGSGLQGVTGMPLARGNIIRPLLDVSREEIEKYLVEQNISYKIDKTNNENDYTRNKIRNIILPQMIEINSGAVEHINQVANTAKEYIEYVDDIINNIYSNIVTFERGKHYISVEELNKHPELIQKKILYKVIVSIANKAKDVTNAHVMSVMELLDKEAGKQVNLAYGIVAKKQYTNILLYIENEEELLGDMVLDDNSTEYWNGDTCIKIRKFEYSSDYEIPKKQYTKAFDYDKIKFNLHFRYFKDEDYIIINNDGNKKKLNRLFIDNKIPALERKNILVIADGNSVLWVLGIRASEEYKIDEATRTIIEIEYNTKEKN